MIESDAPGLLDLIARRWETPSSIVAAVFSTNSASVVFVGSDGKVWQTQSDDIESPTRRFRVAADTGRPTISPRRKAVKPLFSPALDDDVTCIAPLRDSFVLGCRSGRLLTMSAGGRIAALAKHACRIDLLSANGQYLFAASGGSISRYNISGFACHIVAQSSGAVAGLATQGGNAAVAWIDESGLHRWDPDPECLVDTPLALEVGNNTKMAMAWSPGNRWLGIGQGAREVTLVRFEDRKAAQTIRLPNYPEGVNELSWNAAGDLLATSGAFRIVAWDVGCLKAETDVLPNTRQTGSTGYVAVSTVAFNPQKPLVAAGYENGRVTVAQAGQVSELVLRDAGSGRMTALSWSDDGNHLAFGTSAGEAVVATFPPSFFK